MPETDFGIMAPLFRASLLMKPATCSPRAWRVMRSAGSLTQQLQRADAQFSVRVLREGISRLTRDERQALRCAALSGWVREVSLCLDGVAVVWARSVTTQRAVRQAWRAVVGLGRRPLGEVLWQDPHVRRGGLSFARQPMADGARLARRSCFWRQGQPLLVMEAFLPALQEFF